jgi:hypothetical protein
MTIMAAGYSGTPLAQKFGIRVGNRLSLVHAPQGFETTLEGLPEAVQIDRGLQRTRRYHVIVSFVSIKKLLNTELRKAMARLETDGGLWLAWPKKSSGVATDVTEAAVRETGIAAGLVDNKVCAIDETWSGLRFCFRVAERPTRPANR